MPIFRPRIAAVAVVLFGASGALAQQTAPVDHLSACRLDDERVALNFTFEGGACQEPGEAAVETAEGGVANVTVPTERVGEVCTMQIVPVEFSGTIAVEEEIAGLEIVVLDPDGEPQALGSTDVMASGPECEEPEHGAEAEAAPAE